MPPRMIKYLGVLTQADLCQVQLPASLETFRNELKMFLIDL